MKQITRLLKKGEIFTSKDVEHEIVDVMIKNYRVKNLDTNKIKVIPQFRIVNNENFYIEDIKALCKKYKKHIKDFHNFMAGQTMSWDEEKKRAIYFGCDVYRFFRNLETID